MASGNGRVDCEKCNNSVAPRLWHEDDNNVLFNRSIQHICPICGVTMYNSGGGLSLIGYFVFGAVALMIASSIIVSALRTIGFSLEVANFLSTISIGFIIVWYIDRRTRFIMKTKSYLKRNNK